MIVMELFSVEYYKKEQFSLLRDDWKRLEKGPDMTYFQSYDWYEMLNVHYVPDDTSDYVSIYVVLRKKHETILIAPLWIVKHTFRWVNKKGIYFLGREGWSDYLNFVYNEFDGDGLCLLLNDISKKYGVYNYKLSELRQNVKSLRFLINRFLAKRDELGTCVSLKIPNTQEEYKSILSKNARQNVRTAHNRLIKDDIDIRIVFDDSNVNRDICRDIREHRFLKKFQKRSGLRKLKQNIGWRLTYHFRQFLPFYSYDKGGFLTLYHGEVLCSFFYYLKDDIHHNILIIAAGVNMNYLRYSPGIISLNSFINYLIETREVEEIDFTRGNEPYKYAVGGKDHYIETISFRIK